MISLTNLHFIMPISITETTKLTLNKIEKRVAIAAAVVFSAIAMACFVIFHLKNRKADKIKEADKKINLDFKEKSTQTEENIPEEKKPTADSPIKQLIDQVSTEKEKEIESIQKPIDLIQKPVREMTYEEHEMKLVVEIFSKQQMDAQVIAECKAYFERAILQPVDKLNIIKFYRIIEGQTEIVKMILNAAIESLNSKEIDQKENQINCYDNLFKILLILDYAVVDGGSNQIVVQSLFNFLQELLNYAMNDPYSKSGQTLRKIINSFVGTKDPNKLVQLIFNTVPDPFTFIVSLLITIQTDNQRKLMEASLPSIKEAHQLEKLYHLTYGSGIDLFSSEHIEILFQYWIKKYGVNEEITLKLICKFLDLRIKDKSMSNIKMIEEILTSHPDIDLEKLINTYNDPNRYFHNLLLPYLSGFYFMRHLKDKNNSDQVKMEKMHAAIDFTDQNENKNPLNDERILLGAFLAKSCSNVQLPGIIRCFRQYNGIKQRLVESFIKTILRDGDYDRILLTFEAYLINYEEFNVQLPHIEWVLLEEIKSDEVLKAVNQAIKCLPVDKTDKMKTLLRKGVDVSIGGNKKEYRVRLHQDVINRIVL